MPWPNMWYMPILFMMSILILYQIIILFMLNFVINLLKECYKKHMVNPGVRMYGFSDYYA